MAAKQKSVLSAMSIIEKAKQNARLLKFLAFVIALIIAYFVISPRIPILNFHLSQKEIVKLTEKLKNGDKDAFQRLSLYYMNTDTNDTKPINFFREYQDFDIKAKINLAVLLSSRNIGSDMEESIKILESLPENNHRALTMLIIIYENKKEMHKALYWAKKVGCANMHNKEVAVPYYSYIDIVKNNFADNKDYTRIVLAMMKYTRMRIKTYYKNDSYVNFEQNISSTFNQQELDYINLHYQNIIAQECAQIAQTEAQ
jgi:hypothetical protein